VKRFALALCAIACGLGVGAAAARAGLPGTSFVHVATVENVSSNATALDHPLLNGNPGAIVFVTQSWNPFEFRNDHPVGLYYYPDTQNWWIYNEDSAPMTPPAAFNVFIPHDALGGFVHESAAENVSLNWTDVEHPQADGDPDAILLVTHVFAAGGGAGSYHLQTLGVWLQEFGTWAIFNQDESEMEIGHDFHVLVAPDDPAAFLHVATVQNLSDNQTYIDHPLTNGRPNAQLQVTPVWNPGGADDGVYVPAPIGVWYDESSELWGVFNQDLSVMPEGAAFNVVVAPEPAAIAIQGAAVAVLLGAGAWRRRSPGPRRRAGAGRAQAEPTNFA
jgi:hypothetical protein